VVRLTSYRERDEAEQVDREDEEQQRRHVGEPATERLRRQPLLRDLRLRDLVERLADGLPAAGHERQAASHREEPEHDRQDRAKHQVNDGLRDRQVERAQVDRDPLVLLELRRRVEAPSGERRLRCEQCEGREEEQDPKPGQAGVPKKETSDSPSSKVYASP
jgi:hypothetical protein